MQDRPEWAQPGQKRPVHENAALPRPASPRAWRFETTRAPRLGEHTDSIAERAGVRAERIAELRDLGVFK